MTIYQKTVARWYTGPSRGTALHLFGRPIDRFDATIIPGADTACDSIG